MDELCDIETIVLLCDTDDLPVEPPPPPPDCGGVSPVSLMGKGVICLLFVILLVGLGLALYYGHPSRCNPDFICYRPSGS